MKPPRSPLVRVALSGAVLTAAAMAIVAVWLPRPERPCVPPVLPEPAECCAGCTPYDAGCGLLACAPGTGIGCGPCPRFE